MNSDENPKPSTKSREKRYSSHALVEVRRFKHFSIFCYSGVLLDMNLSGFKLEFTSEVRAVPGKRYWLHIPLSPLGIPGPKRLICLCECRWFDEERYRIGGTFVNLGTTESLLVEQIVAGLKSIGQI